MTRTLTAAVVAVLLMLLTACGGGSDSESSSDPSASASSSAVTSATSEDDATAAKAIADSFMDAQKSGGSTAQLLRLKRKDADCVGSGMVDEVGTAQLQEYGLLTKDMKVGANISSLKMSKTDAEATSQVLFTCTDVEKMMRDAVAGSGAIPQRVQGCVNRALDEEALRPMFTKIFQGRSAEAQRELTAPLLRCAKQAQR